MHSNALCIVIMRFYKITLLLLIVDIVMNSRTKPFFIFLPLIPSGFLPILIGEIVLKRTVCFFILLLLISSRVYPETARLREKVFAASTAIPVSELFSTPVPWDFTVNIGFSKYFANDEIARQLAAHGVRDWTIIGRGVDVVVAFPQDVRPAVYDRVERICPSAGRNYDLPAILQDAALRGVEAVCERGMVALRLELILFTNRVGYLTNVYHVAPVAVAVQTASTNVQPDVMTITELNGTDAVAVYRNGGVMITIKAKVVRSLGGGRYLLENPQTHRQFEAVAGE